MVGVGVGWWCYQWLLTVVVLMVLVCVVLCLCCRIVINIGVCVTAVGSYDVADITDVGMCCSDVGWFAVLPTLFCIVDAGVVVDAGVECIGDNCVCYAVGGIVDVGVDVIVGDAADAVCVGVDVYIDGVVYICIDVVDVGMVDVVMLVFASYIDDGYVVG